MENKNNKIAFYFVAFLAVWGLLLCKVAISSMPYNPLSGGKMSRSNFSILIPQGWAFFTKNPREPMMLLYKKEGGEYKIATEPNASMYNLFGASRIGRAKGIEMGALSSQVTDKLWHDCNEGLEACSSMIDTLKAIPVINQAYKAKLCGEFILVSKEPVPWAWGASFSTIHMPSQTIKINSICLN